MKRFLPILVLAILATGCQLQNQSASPNLMPTRAFTPTYQVSSIYTASPEITPTKSNPYLITQCISVQTTIPKDLTSDAVLIMQNIVDRPQIKENYGLDLATNSLFLISQPWEGIMGGKISPDGKWIAYKRSYWDNSLEEYTHTEIVVAALDAKTFELIPRKVVPDNPDWFFLTESEWINDSQLLMGIRDQLQPSDSSTNTVLIWNPISNEKQIIRPEFPDIYKASGAINPYWGYGVVLYNPRLTQALYLTGNGVSSVVYQLWDIEKQKSIAEYELINNYDIPPRWSPDGSRLALIDGHGDGEISIIEADGEISQLTHVGDNLKYWEIQNLSWSSDGQYIAFSLWSKLSDSGKNPDDKIATLAIADTQTGKVVDTCIPVSTEYGAQTMKLFWSPDSSQLVVKDESVEDYNRLILIDLEQGIAAQIGEFMEPFGWMVPQE